MVAAHGSAPREGVAPPGPARNAGARLQDGLRVLLEGDVVRSSRHASRPAARRLTCSLSIDRATSRRLRLDFVLRFLHRRAVAGAAAGTPPTTPPTTPPRMLAFAGAVAESPASAGPRRPRPPAGRARPHLVAREGHDQDDEHGGAREEPEARDARDPAGGSHSLERDRGDEAQPHGEGRAGLAVGRDEGRESEGRGPEAEEPVDGQSHDEDEEEAEERPAGRPGSGKPIDAGRRRGGSSRAGRGGSPGAARRRSSSRRRGSCL